MSGCMRSTVICLIRQLSENSVKAQQMMSAHIPIGHVLGYFILTPSDLAHNRIFVFSSPFSFTSLMTCWRPMTGRLYPSDSRFFFIGAPWPSVEAPVHWWEHWCTFFFPWASLFGRFEHLFPQVPPPISSFFFTIVASVLLLSHSFLRPCLMAVAQ
jgi:hypothetical protein